MLRGSSSFMGDPAKSPMVTPLPIAPLTGAEAENPLQSFTFQGATSPSYLLNLLSQSDALKGTLIIPYGGFLMGNQLIRWVLFLSTSTDPKMFYGLTSFPPLGLDTAIVALPSILDCDLTEHSIFIELSIKDYIQCMYYFIVKSIICLCFRLRDKGRTFSLCTCFQVKLKDCDAGLLHRVRHTY
jgi:hypothetical protein